MADINKSLQDFFESARNAKPPISKEESRSFIENHGPDGHAHSHQATSKFFRKITPMKAYSIMALTALTAGSIYYYAHRTPIADKAAYVVESPTPVAVSATDTIKKPTVETTTNAPNIQRRFKIEITDDNASSPVSSTLNDLLFTDDANTFKLFLGNLGGSFNQDSVKIGVAELSHAFDSIKTVFNRITIDTSSPNDITIHNAPGMDHDTTLAIPESEHMTRRELVEKLDSAKALINNLSPFMALDTTYPGNPAIAFNKQYMNDISVSQSSNVTHITSGMNQSDTSSAGENKVIYSNNPATLKFSIGALSGNDSAGKIAAGLQQDKDTVKRQLKTMSYNSNDHGFMDSVKTLVDDIVIDTTSSGNPSIDINNDDINSISVKNPNQKGIIKVYKTIRTQNGDSTPVMIQIKMDRENVTDEDSNPSSGASSDYFSSSDTLTLRMDLRNGKLTVNSFDIDSLGSMTPELFQRLYLEKAHLNAITIDTVSSYPDLSYQEKPAMGSEPATPLDSNIRPNMQIVIHDAFIGADASVSAGIQPNEGPVAMAIMQMFTKLRNTLNGLRVKTSSALAMDTVGKDHLYQFSIMPHDSIVVVQFYKIHTDSTMRAALDKYAEALRSGKASLSDTDVTLNSTLLRSFTPFSRSLNESADSSLLKALQPYADSPNDSCLLLLAQSLHKFRTDDSTFRETRLTKGLTNYGASLEIMSIGHHPQKDTPSDSSLQDRNSEEYFAEHPHNSNALLPGDPANTLSLNITGTRMITLSADELSKLGIVACASGICTYSTEHYHGQTDQYFNYFGMGGTMRLNTCQFSKLNYNSQPPAVTTDDQGTVRRITYSKSKVDAELARQANALPFGSKERFLLENKLAEEGRIATMKQINTFIPILVKTGRAYTAHDSALGFTHPDLIFWYEPTPELLALLPDSLKAQLSTELAAADSTIHKVEFSLLTSDSLGVNLPEIAVAPKVSVSLTAPPPLAVTPDTNQAKYFDLWRASSGVITASLVYPNPTNGDFTVQYTLAEARTVTATLHDISGHAIQVLGKLSSAAGISTINAHVQGVAPGIYLVALTTDKGEQAVQRVIIER